MSAYDEENGDGIELYPPWKEALAAFERAKYTYGALISREWFARAFGLMPPEEDRRYTPKEIQTYELAFLSNMTALREAVLEQHRMYLVSDQRGSYLIVPPNEQAPRAMREMQRKLGVAIDKCIAVLRNIEVAMLTDEERQRHIDLLTKALDTQFRLSHRRRELPDEDDEE